nr:hypothetical protein [Tanacetum cinerariifolium]
MGACLSLISRTLVEPYGLEISRVLKLRIANLALQGGSEEGYGSLPTDFGVVDGTKGFADLAKMVPEVNKGLTLLVHVVLRRKHQQFYEFAVNRESARDVYSKCRIITVTELQIVAWHNYKHLDWITMCRDDDKLYKFKEGDFKRLCIIDIEDMLLLLGVRMKYLPQAIWGKSDKERATAMIQAIDKQLKTRRIMRSLEKFVGGRLYEGDFRMLQRTI